MGVLGLSGRKTVVLGIAVLMSWAGYAEPATQARPYEPTPLAQSSLSMQRRADSNIRIFRDRSGVPTFTNRVQKYRAKQGYTELNIKFEPIQVDPTYRKMKATNSYDVSSIAHLVEEHCRRWNLDECLVYAMIRAESNFKQDAVSPAGARGLMQLMPATAAEMGVQDIFDPAENIAGGTQYIAKMLELFDNNVDLALAAYNSGPKTVLDCGKKIPNIRETRNYVERVKRYREEFAGRQATPTYVAAAKKPKPAEVPKVDTTPLKTIHYLSGLTQPAEKIRDEHPQYYYVEFKGRIFPVPKKLVKEIV